MLRQSACYHMQVFLRFPTHLELVRKLVSEEHKACKLVLELDVESTASYMALASQIPVR
jgi:hypothetical protein